MAHVVAYRAHHVGKAVGAGGVFAQIVVAVVKLALGDFLVVEHLDDLLAIDHFFDIAVQAGQGGLLLDKEGAALCAQLAGHFQHGEGAQHHHQRKPHAAIEHGDEHHQQRNGRGEHIGQRLADQLAQRVGIVGVEAHHFAVGVGIEIADGQQLHVRKHLVAHILEDAVRYDRHNAALQEHRHHGQQVQPGHLEDGGQQARVYGRDAAGSIGQQRHNVIVNQCAQERGGRGRGDRVQHDAEEHNQQARPIGLQIA